MKAAGLIGAGLQVGGNVGEGGQIEIMKRGDENLGSEKEKRRWEVRRGNKW